MNRATARRLLSDAAAFLFTMAIAFGLLRSDILGRIRVPDVTAVAQGY